MVNVILGVFLYFIPVIAKSVVELLGDSSRPNQEIAPSSLGLHVLSRHLAKRNALAMVLFRRRRLRLKHQRKEWVRQINLKRKSLGEFHGLIQELKLGDSTVFKKYFRMTQDQFHDVLSKISHRIVKKTTNFREPISPAERLAITLRFLSIGDSQQTIAFSYRVGHCTVEKIVGETCKALWLELSPIHLKIPDTAQWRRIALEFGLLWNYPNCVGAIDGKHINIQCPNLCGSTFFNYKNFFSIVLLAACDAQYRFTLIDVGASGKSSDGGVFSSSAIGRAIEMGTLGLPEALTIPGCAKPIPHVFVADEAFPLKENMMRPFPGKNLTEDCQIYNYRHSRARRTVENAFGILVTTWRIFKRPIILHPETVVEVVKACCCLHNYLRAGDNELPPELLDREDSTGHVTSGEWRASTSGGLTDTNSLGTNAYKREVKTVRENFKEYFLSKSGSVSWQLEYVRRGKKKKQQIINSLQVSPTE